MEALALELEQPILKGTEVIVYVGTKKSPGKIVKINFIMNANNGAILKKNPKLIRSDDCAEIEI